MSRRGQYAPTLLPPRLLPRVTVGEVRRFADAVEIRDAEAFAAELEVFMQERLEQVELPASLEVVPGRQAVEHALAGKVARPAGPQVATPLIAETIGLSQASMSNRMISKSA